MGFYNRMRIDQKKLDRIKSKIPSVLDKMLQFHRVKLMLSKRFKEGEYGSDALKSNLQKFIEVLDREKRFNKRLGGYVTNLKSSEEEIKRLLAREAGSEKGEIQGLLIVLLEILDYLVFHFNKYGSNIKKERKIGQRLLDQPKRRYLIFKYNYNDDLEKLDSIYREVTGGLAIIVDTYEERCEEKIQEFMGKWKRVMRAKKLKYGIFPLAVVSMTLTTTIVYIYKNYIVRKFEFWGEYAASKKEIISKVEKRIIGPKLETKV